MEPPEVGTAARHPTVRPRTQMNGEPRTSAFGSSRIADPPPSGSNLPHRHSAGATGGIPRTCRRCLNAIRRSDTGGTTRHRTPSRNLRPVQTVPELGPPLHSAPPILLEKD